MAKPDPYRSNLVPHYTENDRQYHNDPAFHAVATMAYKIVAEGQLSPEELRRAVMHGVYLYEMRRGGQVYFEPEKPDAE